MKLKLNRIFLGEEYTIGKLYINDEYFCDTLEDRVVDLNKNGKFDGSEKKVNGQSAIPYGTYDVIVNMSPRFKRMLPRILNVPHFEGVLIHRGNTHKDTDGCILVGKNTQKGMVLESAKHEIELTRILLDASKSESIQIEIA